MKLNKEQQAAKEECLGLLIECSRGDDSERAHSDADDALIEFLRALGFSEIADTFDKLTKWYG